MDKKHLKRMIRKALREDVGQEDLTTNLTVPEDSRCAAELIAKQSGVLSGMAAFRAVFKAAGAKAEDWDTRDDGSRFEAGEVVARFTGRTRPVLTAERTALNFVQHLSGVATKTAAFVEAVEGIDVRICDTRKTIPLFRDLEKEAVVHGGGSNHRHTLHEGILIKENHIEAAGGIEAAVKAVASHVHHLMKIEVEVTNLDEFAQALAAGADVIMLDNMPCDLMSEAVAKAAGTRVLLEASGNVTLENIRQIAETGVDVISIGGLTHSAPAADLSLLITAR